MTQTPTAAVVLAAGLGTRMRSSLPKHFHPLLGRRMVDWVIVAARAAGAERVVVVCSPAGESLFEGVETAVQQIPRGTGDAVGAARDTLADFDGDVLVLSGDVPGLSAELVGALIAEHRACGAAATVLSFRPADTRSYGRIVRGPEGRLARIVEAADATEQELCLGEVNSGIYLFRASKLWPTLERLEAHNTQGELYLTDTIGLLVADGEEVAVQVAPDPFEVEGVNTRVELAAVAAGLRDRINTRHMLAGVTLVDPDSTWIHPEVEIEPDVTIHPFVVLEGTTQIATGAQIRSHSVLTDAQVATGAIVGPFCYLRPGTVLDADSKAGTFVEIKNSRVGARSKVPHLSYIGDCDIGEDSNLGAGAITANLPHQPGEPKRNTKIGRNVRAGIQNGFIAPVEVGDGAWTAAGSTITESVPPDALAVARARQENKEGMQLGAGMDELSFAELEELDGGEGPVIAPRQGHWLEGGPQKRLMVFSGSSHPELAQRIAEHLGVELADVELKTFANGETYSRYNESIRGADLFIVQTGCDPIDRNLMELLQLIQAARLGSAKRITAVIPLFPYARQDRKAKPREPITARLVADLLQTAGADRVLTMDLHAGQIQGFFTIPVDHMTALPLFARHFRDLGLHGEGVVSVSPDTGRAKQAERFADMIGSTFAIMHKSRPAHDEAKITEVAGRVRGKRAIIGDDVIMTGRTMLANVQALEEHGASEVWLFATHGLFCGDSLERFDEIDAIKGIVVTDTVPIDPRSRPEKLTVLPSSYLLAETIMNVFSDDSVSAIFGGENQLF